MGERRSFLVHCVLRALLTKSLSQRSVYPLSILPAAHSTHSHTQMDAQKLKTLQNNVRIGGKGSVRRKHKGVRKTAAGDNKKLDSALKRLGVQPVSPIDEVLMFNSDNTVLQFSAPKLEIQPSANLFVVRGPSEKKS